MESAVLLFITASLSVMFGWQPMPTGDAGDGREKVEYIVQLEPEMLASLRDGQSIPITSDIPDDIGPIGRIRIVVGRDELPRQKLATQLKPLPPNESTQQETRDGLIEAQYRVEPVESSGGRYGNQAATNQAAAGNQIFPPGENPRVATNPLARELQQGAQEARDMAADVRDQILPLADQLFGNDGGRTASANQTVDSNPQNQPQAKILPPSSSSQPQVEQQRGDPWQGERPTPPGNFAADSAHENLNARSGNSILPGDWSNQVDNKSTATGQPSRYGSSQNSTNDAAPTWPSERTGRDAFDVANQHREISPPTDGNNLPPQYTAANNGSPRQEKSGTFGADLHIGQPQHPPRQSADSRVRTKASAPEIRRDMLSNPVDDGFQTASARPDLQQPPPATQPVGNSPSETTSQNVPSQNFGWSREGEKTAAADGNTPPSDKTLFPLLLSWVLLSGSGAGNAYLWWSYLDVRSKYQGVVHGSSRRRERYDD